MGESFKEFSKRTGLPQPQSTYIFLAIQGKDVWNHWINGEMSEDEEAALAKKLGFSVLPNRNSTPNFSSIDFRDDPIKDIDFTDFEFPTKLRVHNAIIPCVDFSAAKFGNQARFTNAVFGDGAEFHGTGFGNGTRFLNTTFGSFCSFKCSTFGGGAGFVGAIFGAWTQFDGVTFGAIAHFENSAFGQNAFFHEPKIYR